MKPKKSIPKKEFNFSDFYEELKTLHADIRANICYVCDWSEATFYRKFRKKRSYSRAEKKAIMEVCHELIQQATDRIPKL